MKGEFHRLARPGNLKGVQVHLVLGKYEIAGHHALARPMDLEFLHRQRARLHQPCSASRLPARIAGNCHDLTVIDHARISSTLCDLVAFIDKPQGQRRQDHGIVPVPRSVACRLGP